MLDEYKTAIEKSGALKSILFGGLLAGILDLAAAIISNGLRGTNPPRVLQSIASGLLGAASFTGGTPTILLGTLLHFIIAFAWAIIFYLASRRIKFLTNQPIISGALYGIAVYIMMYYVVVPLSAAPFQLPRDLAATTRDVFIHIVCIGLPIALVTRRFSK